MPTLADEFALPDVAEPAPRANLLDEFDAPEPRQVEDLARDTGEKVNEWNRTWKDAKTPEQGVELLRKWVGDKAADAFAENASKEWERANTPVIKLPRLNVPSMEQTPESMRLMQKPASVIAGAYNAVAGAAEGLTTPLNIGTLGAFGALQKVAAGTGLAAKAAQWGLAALKTGFGVEMAKSTGEQAGKASVELADQSKSLQEKTETALSPVITGGLAIISAAHGGKDVAELTAPKAERTGPTVTERVIEGEGAKVQKSLEATREAARAVETAQAPAGRAPTPDQVPPVQVEPARLTREVKSDSGYVYHATNAERLQEIADSGELVPHEPSYGTDQNAWPDGGTEDRSYFSRRADVVWQFAPEEGKPVVLRTREGANLNTESHAGDVYSRKPIPASDLEYLGTDGNWHPVAKPETAPTAAAETGAIQFTIQRPQEFEGRTIPGYTQIERRSNAGRGEPLTEDERDPHKALADEAINAGIPTGQYTEAQLREFIASKTAPAPNVTAEFTAPPASGETVSGQPPETPAGGAAPEPLESKTTSIKNEIVDQERAARGLPPAMQEAAREFPDVWDEAMKRVDENPEVATNLVSDLKQKPRALTDVEDAILLRAQIEAQNDFSEVSRRIAEGRGTPDQLAADRLTQTQIANDLLDIYNVGKSAGRETSRGLNARKMLADENFTLGEMVTLRRAQRGGAELTPAQLAVTEKLQAEIDKLQTDFAAYRARASELLMSDKAGTPRKKSVGGRVVAALTEQANAARERMKARRTEGRVSAGIDPAEFADIAIIGAEYIAKGVVKAAEWGEAMVKEFGERIRPQLGALRTKAEETVGDVDFSSALEARKAQLQKRIDTLTQKIEAGDLSSAARKASRPAVEEIEKLMQERDDLQETMTGMREQAAKVKELETAVEEKTRKLAEGDLSVKGTAQNRPAPEEIEKLKQERDALNDDLAKARQEANKATPEEVLDRRVAAVNKKIAELRERIRTGNLAPESAPANRPAPAELEKARQELEAVTAEIADLRKGPARPAEEVRTEAYKKRTAARIAELERRIEEGDFSKRERRPVQMDPEANKIQAQLEAKQDEFYELLEKDKFERLSAIGKVKARAIAFYDLQRTIQTTGELSFILRQGAFSAASAPITTARAVPNAIRALFADPVTARAIDLEIFNHPDARAALKSGLSLVKEGERLSRQDELIGAEWINKVWGLRHFAQSARVFMNRLRFEVWRDMRRTLDNPTELEDKQIAKFVNQSTGRGGLGRAEPLAIQLGRVLYSPRFLASRIQMVAGESMWGGNLRTRQAIAKRYARFLVGAGAYYYVMSQILGDDKKKPTINWDTNSTDFGKVKIGDTRIDPLGGLAQVIVFGSRMITGKTTDARGHVKKVEPGDVALRFLRSKLAPIPGSLLNLYIGTDLAGNPATLENQAKNLVQPLSYVDIYQALQDSDDLSDEAIFTLMSLLGQGLQTYDANERRKKPLRPNPANRRDPGQPPVKPITVEDIRRP